MAVAYVAAVANSVATINGSGTNGGVTTFTVSVTPAVGELLVLKIGTGDAKTTVTSVTDNQGTTWTGGPGAVQTNYATAYIFTARAAVAAATTITITVTNTGTNGTYPCGACVERYTGAAVGTATDIEWRTTTGTGTFSPTTVGSVWTWIDSDWTPATGTTITYSGTNTPVATGSPYRDANANFFYARQAVTATTAGQTFGMTSPTGQKMALAGMEITPGTAWPGAATLAAVSGGSFSGPSERAAAAATLAGISGTSFTAQATEAATATLTSASGMTANGVRVTPVSATLAAASGTTISAPSTGIGVVLGAVSGSTFTAQATEAAAATITGASSATATAGIVARAAATLAVTSGVSFGAQTTDPAAATLAATSGTSFTVFAVRPAQMSTGSASGGTVTTPKVIAVAAATITGVSGSTFTAGPPTAPAAALLTAVSAMNATPNAGELAPASVFAAVSALYADGTSSRTPFVSPVGPVVRQTPVPAWNLLAFDTITGRVGYELPWTTMSWTSKLNDAGTMTATLQVETALDALADQATSDDPRTLLREFLTGSYRYSLAVGYGSQLTWAGPYLPSSPSPDKPTVDIGGVEMLKLLDKRLMLNPAGDPTKPWTDPSWDLTLGGLSVPGLAWAIVQQAMAGGDAYSLPITGNPPSLSGTEQMVYPGYALTTAYKALQDVTNRADGPDVRLDPYLVMGDDGQYVQYQLRIGDPFIRGGGVLGSYGQLPWAWDETTATVTPTVNATGLASRYFVPGAGQDRAKVIGSATSTALTGLGFPALDMVDTQHSSETDPDVLGSFARADAAAAATPQVSWSVKVPAAGDQTPGEYRVGDLAQLDIDRNLYIAPGGYDRRITQIDGDGSPLVTLTCVDDTAVGV